MQMEGSRNWKRYFSDYIPQNPLGRMGLHYENSDRKPQQRFLKEVMHTPSVILEKLVIFNETDFLYIL